MTKTILLAVDAARSDPGEHVAAAAEMTRQLALGTGDDVVVLHVHEYAVGRWGRAQVDCHEGAGESVVDQVVSGLLAAGVTVKGVIGSADYGHVASAILKAADQYDTRMIVLGSSSRTDLPLLPFGSVSNRLLHLAKRPVLITPKHPLTGPVTAPEAKAAATG